MQEVEVRLTVRWGVVSKKHISFFCSSPRVRRLWVVRVCGGGGGTEGSGVEGKGC